MTAVKAITILNPRTGGDINHTENISFVNQGAGVKE
jgi:hypothetical protein